MKWLNDIKIRDKHIFIFGVLLAVLIVFAIFAVLQIINIGDKSNALVNTSQTKQTLVSDAIDDINTIRLANMLMGYTMEEGNFKNIVSRNLKAAEQSALAFTGRMDQFRDLVESDPGLSEREKHQHEVSINGINDAFAKYMDATERLKTAAAANDKDEMIRIYEVVIPMGNDLNDKLQDLRDIIFYEVLKKSSDSVESTSHAINIVIIIAVVFIAIAVFAAFLIVRSIVRPISKMEKAVAEIANGNLSYPIRTDRKDELGSLSASISNMVSELSKQKAIEIAMNEARVANETKSEFLANISHEMRTPLNAVLGLTGLTLEREDLDDETVINLEKVYSSGSTLLNIVNDILDISKIEAGKLEILPSEYDIPSLVNDVITQNILRIGSKLISFGLDITPDVPARLYGDDLRIRQILSNLLSNAFKYTTEGHVELGLRCEKAEDEDSVWMNVWVKDTGQGIRQEDIEKLFSDYSQVDTKANRKIEGTGLGLAITKKMVEMMDGTISVESEYGEGSVFAIKVKQGFVTDEPIGETIVSNLKNFRYSDAKRRQTSRVVRVKMPYARVLVVDDNMTNLDVARGLLKPYSLQVDCVTSGQQAIDAILEEEGRYNAVFMDHMMPGMDGIEATQLIREIGTEYAKKIPIIALTANAIAGNEEKFLTKGFQAFLSKPIDLPRLDEALRHWVRDKTKETEDMEIEDSGDAEGKTPGAGPDATPISSRFHIDGLDLDKGLERFGGDEEVFFGVLRSYTVNTRPVLDSIRTFTEASLGDYAINVHGIKGSSRGIFALGIGDLAEELEHASKNSDLDFVQNNNPRLLDMVEKLISDIEDLFAGLDAENPKEMRDEPDRESLSKLIAAFEDYDIDSINSIMKELEEFDYSSGGELLDMIRDSILEGDFDAITEKLTDWLS